MSRNRSPQNAGFTLIELLVSLGVGVIILSAAVFAGESILRAEYGQTRKSSVDTELAIAQVILDRIASNAGMSYSDARYAVHVWNNVNSSVAGTGPVVAAGASSAGVIAGTDVLDVTFGDSSTRTPGGVAAVPSTNTVWLMTQDPFLTTDPNNLSQALLFTDGNTTSCVGLVQQYYPNGNPAGSPPTVTISQWLDDTYQPGAAMPGCPNVGMSVYALSGRRRFMIYQGANGSSLGLWTQTNVDATGALGPPQLVVTGLEDMQVKERILSGAWASCAGNMYCWCDDGTNGCSVATNASLEPYVRGFNVTLSGTGNQPVQISGEQRPPIYDHAAGPVDNVYHGTAEQSVFAVNVTLSNI